MPLIITDAPITRLEPLLGTTSPYAGLAVLRRAIRQPRGVGEDISAGADKVLAWLRDNNGWVKQHEDAIRDFLKSILPAAKDAAGGVLRGALGGLALAAQLVSSALLMFVFLLYILSSGDAIWGWIQNRFSPGRRDRVTVAGRAA